MEILADTNAWYAGLMCFSSDREDGRPVLVRRRNGDAVAAEIEAAIASKNLVISNTVAKEVIDGIENAFMYAAQSANAKPEAGVEAARVALARFERLRATCGIPDDPRYVEDVARMYADILRDPRMAAAVALWRGAKERRGRVAKFPSPGTHGNDFMILSTAADMAARGIATRLLTYDHDILAFADIIRDRFGVVAVDCASLRR